MSLVPTVKGQEPFHGIPHLQAYRFMRAVLLAEIGEIQLANRLVIQSIIQFTS